MNRVLITDVRYRMSLAIIRSLGRKGIPITAVEYQNTPLQSALGFYSKYADEKELLPNAMSNPKEFIDGIIGLSQAKKQPSEKPVLVPVGLDSLMAIAKNQDALLPHASFIVPPLESIGIANDTRKLMEVAEKAGVPYPETTTLLEGETVEALSQRISYPAVIKYREGELLKLKPEERYRIVRTREAFMKHFPYMHNLQPQPIVQHYVSGSGYGVSVVFDKSSRPLEIFCHKRLREYPVTGGPSCFCESIWDQRLVDYALKLLQELRWTGVAMVEFKGNLDGDIRLMEINPRFWGSLPLSTAADCDIPYAYYRAALGEEVKSPSRTWYKGRYALGKKMRFLLQDIMSLPGYLRMREDKVPFLIKYFLELLDPRVAEGVFQLKDLRPSFQYMFQALKKRKRKQA